MRNRTGIRTAPPGPAESSPPSTAHNQLDECPGHDGHPDEDDAQAQFIHCATSARDDLSGSEVTTHRV